MTDLAQEKPRTGEEPDIDLDEEDEAGDGQLGIVSDDMVAVVVEVNYCMVWRSSKWNRLN